MPTVNSIIQRLLPRGSNSSRPGVWAELPLWPPDVFAVCATLVDRSGCYASPRHANGYPDGADGCFFARAGYYDDINGLAQDWRANRLDRLQQYWSVLMDPAHGEVADHDHPTAQTWQDTAIVLMMVADEVCVAMGFAPRPDLEEEKKKRRMFADHYFEQYVRMLDGQASELEYLPHSLCRMVPPGEVCVQPKTITAQAGCTIRSLSHNLSLLPNWGEVKTTWRFAGQSDTKVMNLLAVPFPYRITASSLVPAGTCTGSQNARWFDEKGNRSNFFDLRQDWLDDRGEPIQACRIATFLIDLINQAQREVGVVHAVVLPELALDRPRAKEVAATLARETSLKLFVTGMANQDETSQLPRNSVFACTITGESYLEWVQNKHHRWKLERDQIRRYHLGSSLRPDYNWWERIDLSRRECEFRVFRHGSSLAALVCEDLARINPVQTVIRSVGPNLVIALLMDGPQFERRWSGRYATILADDPGSAVLTLTSLALVRRSNDPGQGEPRQIALWKQAGGRTEELSLPRGAHALLLNLWPDGLTNFTLDGRSDRGTTTNLFLSGVQTITLANPPAWAVVD